MIGQDAVNTAVAFEEGVGFDGVVLTKLDGDARGGAALSVREVTGRPVMFASTGEKLEDFEQFHPDRMASRILDMGDIMTLIEQAEKAFDEKQAAEIARKFEAGDDFTLEDFLQQMQAMKKMGSLTKLMGMMPGMGEVRKQLEQVDDRDINRIAAIIQSMTPQERRNSKIIDGSRKARIAKGSGVQVSEVNNLLTRFTEAQKMMKQVGRGGMPGMPGMPGMGGGKKSRGKQQPQQRKQKKGRSGNPAKRAAQEAAGAQAPAAAAPGSGLMGGQAEQAAAALEALPPEFAQMVNEAQKKP
jgi:signal recognition particle subunit SRP54